ncbi:MAG: hypothetical protein ACFB03_17840 [Paracoccaceae bacterium]
MVRLFFAALFSFVLCAAHVTHAAEDTTKAEPSEAALAFVGQFSDNQLSGMLSRVGARTETMMMLGQVNGRLTEQIFNAEIDAAIDRHGDAWRRNMALAWTPLLTDDEMLSLAADAQLSPHTEKYASLRTDAGRAMQDLSGDLFRQILQEVVSNTFATVKAAADTE